MLRPRPAELGDAFRVGDPLAHGVGRRRLAAPDLAVPTRGTRMPVETIGEFFARLNAIGLALPDSVAFSHLTAARIHGAPLPLPWSSDEPVHVVSRTTRMPVKRRGIVTHHQVDAVFVERRGLRVVGPATAWVQCGRLLQVDQLVIMGDHLCRDRPDRLAALRREAERHSGRRGVVRLREALGLVGCDSASPPETMLRLLFHRAGLPEPARNRDVYDAGGGWIARPDFTWNDAARGVKVALEYDGDHHRADRRQWEADHQRDRLLRAAGWTVLVLTAADLRHSAPTVDLVSMALAGEPEQTPGRG